MIQQGKPLVSDETAIKIYKWIQYFGLSLLVHLLFVAALIEWL